MCLLSRLKIEDFAFPWEWSDLSIVVDDDVIGRSVYVNKAVLAMWSGRYRDVIKEQTTQLLVYDVNHGDLLELMWIIHPPVVGAKVTRAAAERLTELAKEFQLFELVDWFYEQLTPNVGDRFEHGNGVLLLI